MIEYSRDFLEEKQCPECKRRFYIRCLPTVYGWKIGNDLYCSYSCMRKAEGVLFPPAEEKNLRALPDDVKDVWADMVVLRAYSRKYDHLRRMKYAERLTAKSKAALSPLIAECGKHIESIKTRYSYAVNRLRAESYDIIYGFAIRGWNKNTLIQKSGLAYDDLCDRLVEILRFLKRNKSNDFFPRRWICKAKNKRYE